MIILLCLVLLGVLTVGVKKMAVDTVDANLQAAAVRGETPSGG